MQNILVFSRRGIHIRPSLRGGEYNALFVPSDDQLTVLRDVTPNTEEITQRVRAEGRTPLWREKPGHVLVYGYLSPELKEVRQGLKVWLAEDFVPQGHEAFFFVFPNCAVHGLKEIDDERRETWRCTMLFFNEADLAREISTAVADLVLRYTPKEICVAAAQLPENKLSGLNASLEKLGVTGMSLGTLTPAPKAQPLYRHRDFSVWMVLSIALLAALFLGILGHNALNWVEVARLERKAIDLRDQINAVQINESLGYIREPQPMLEMMKRPFNREPSAILDAAARFGRVLGELKEVSFRISNENNPAEASSPLGVIPVSVKYNTVYDKLLVNQEKTIHSLLPSAPWIRSVSSVPEGVNPALVLQIQISSPPDVAIPSATSVFQPVTPPSPTIPAGDFPGGGQ